MRLPELPPSTPIAVDCETSGLHPDDGAFLACVAVAWEGGSLALPFDQGVRDKYPAVQLDMFEPEDPNLGSAEWRQMHDWLVGRRLIFHNAKFDLAFLEVGTRFDPGVRHLDSLYWDTALGAKELDPIESGKLDEAAERAGLGRKQGLTALKEWLRSHRYPPNRYDLVPWNICEPYVTSDAELTIGLYLKQRRRIEQGEGDRSKIKRELHGVLPTLYLLERRGIGYDAELSQQAAEELDRRANEVERRMPFKCDVNSAKRWFFQTRGLPADRYTDKGNPSLDEEQVRRWAAEGVQWAPEYAQVTKARRAVSMWYRGYAEKRGTDGRLRCSYRQTKVRSGRMSVERVQLQAMPKSDKEIEGIPGVRTLLRARPGYGLWNLDLSQAELRVATKYSGCRHMRHLLDEGADIHGDTCQRILHINPTDPNWKTKRDIAKRLTFGAIFQIGGETFQATLSKLADIHLPIGECQALVYEWRQLYPEFGVAYRKAEKRVERQRNVKLLPGTEYESLSWFGPQDWSNTGWNRMVQGSLAEAFKLWMVEIEREWPGYMVLTVHDSVLLEAPLDEGAELAQLAKARGAALCTDLFDIPMSVDVGRWDAEDPPDKATKGDDQFAGVA